MPVAKTNKISFDAGRVATYALEKATCSNGQANGIYVKKALKLQDIFKESKENKWTKFLGRVNALLADQLKKPLPNARWEKLYHSILTACKKDGFNPEEKVAKLKQTAERLLRERGTSRVSSWSGQVQSYNVVPQDSYYTQIVQTPLLEADEEQALAWKAKEYQRAIAELLTGEEQKEFLRIQEARSTLLCKLWNTTVVDKIPKLEYELEAGLEREKEILENCLASWDGTKALVRLKDESQAARWLLIEANLRLALNVAASPGFQDRGIDLPVLNEAAVMGLIRTVDLFDYRLSFRFSTYATRWIKQAILKELDEGPEQIHVPENARNKIKKYRIAEDMSFMAEEPFDQFAAARRVLHEKTRIDAKELIATTKRGYVSIDYSEGENDASSVGLLPPSENDPEPLAEKKRRDYQRGLKELLGYVDDPARKEILRLLLNGKGVKAIATDRGVRHQAIGGYKNRIIAHLQRVIPPNKLEELEELLLGPR